MLIRLPGAITFAIALLACGRVDGLPGRAIEGQRLITAENFIDAFYSFDPIALRSALSSAQGSIPLILFYQGWAEGGNYKILNRKPCQVENDHIIICSITVRDDLIQALGINFNVTDSFHLKFSDEDITSVTIDSNDPREYNEAQEWVRMNHPEIFSGPCKGFFDGGATPGDCVRAVVLGYSEFAEANELRTSRKASDQ